MEQKYDTLCQEYQPQPAVSNRQLEKQLASLRTAVELVTGATLYDILDEIVSEEKRMAEIDKKPEVKKV